jgi:hypothetical protein
VPVFEVEDHAYAWRTEIAKNGWARSWTEPELHDVANEYFDRVEYYDETFDVEDHEVEWEPRGIQWLSLT